MMALDSERPAVPRGLWVVVILFFAGYLTLVAWYTTPHAAGADASGYLNSAKLLLDGKLSTPLRQPPWAADAFAPDSFVPLGMRLDPTRSLLVPGYPIGQPLQLAAFGAMFGWDLGPAAMNVLAMLGSAFLLRSVALRLGARPHWALPMLVLWALSPLVLSYSLQVMSELTSTFWILAAIHAALRTGQRRAWALAAGAALAMAVLVRPANLIAAVPVVLALRPGLLTFALFGTGGLPLAAFLAWYNSTMYGSAVATGYGEAGDLFLARHIGPTLAHYACWLPVQLTPLVVAGLALPFMNFPRRTRLVLCGWAGVFLAFYASYYHTHETWWTLRFLVPALPALAIASTLVLQRWNRPVLTLAAAGPRPGPDPASWRKATVGAVALLLPFALAWQVAWQRHFKVHHHEGADRVYPLMSDWIDKHAPADAIVMARMLSGALYFYTDRGFMNFETLDPASYARFNSLAARHGFPVYAALMDHEEKRAFEVLPGTWERVAQIRYGSIWRRVAP